MADGITAVSAGVKGPRQFQGLFDIIPFKLTFEDDSILDGDNYSGGATVSVPGAALGDFVLVSVALDAVECQFYANVTAADTVEVTLQNTTGGTVTAFATGAVINGLVLKPKQNVFAFANS